MAESLRLVAERTFAMFRLLYISTSRAPITPELLDAILRTSLRRNAAVGVTGLLLAGGTRFLQVLEGDEPAVRATYARICDDPRHGATVRLSEGPITTRSFPNWAMGSIAAGSADAKMPTGEAIATLLAPITDPVLKGYFDGFVAVKRAA